MCHNLIRLACVVITVLVIGSGCRKDEPETEPLFSVRLLTSAPVSGRWERAAERGLGRIAAELDADIRRLRAKNEAERRSLLISEGNRGVDLMFCVGAGFEKTLYTEAAAYPDTRFVILPARAGGGNVAGVEFLSEGAGYVAGVVAAHLREGGAAGVLRGTGGEWLERLEEGFVRGLRSVDASGEHVTVASPEGPKDLADQGVTVSLYATDRPEDRVIAEARTVGLLLVASELDLLGRETDVVAAAVSLDVAEAMVRLAREVREGTFVGRPYTFDLGSGVLDVVLNPEIPVADVEGLREALEVAKSEVTAGIVELEKLGM